MENKVLTIEEIDAQKIENNARLAIIDDELVEKNAELGSKRGLRLGTKSIHAEIDALEREKRELTAENKWLDQQRERLQQAAAREIAEAAAAEYNALIAQLNPSAADVLNTLYAAHAAVVAYAKIRNGMSEQALIAGNLVPPVPYDEVILFQAGPVIANISGTLDQIIRFASREVIERAGVVLTDLDDPTASRRIATGKASEPAPLAPSTGEDSMLSSARVAAGLESAAVPTNSEPSPVLDSARRGAGLPE